MKRLLTVTVVSTALFSAMGAEEFLQLSLTPDVALRSRDTVIKGISLNIWGKNEQTGFALGFVNGSKGDSSGFSWGMVNYAERYTGLQLGIVNYSSDLLTGMQWGTVNVANKVSGLQMGLVNYTKDLNGVQIGFANIVQNNGWFDKFPDKLAKAFVFVNWSF
jgi:hypothetical protein